LENSNGDILAMDHLIYYVFGLMVGFSESADQIAAISSWTKLNKCVGENNA